MHLNYFFVALFCLLAVDASPKKSGGFGKVKSPKIKIKISPGGGSSSSSLGYVDPAAGTAGGGGGGFWCSLPLALAPAQSQDTNNTITWSVDTPQTFYFRWFNSISVNETLDFWFHGFYKRQLALESRGQDQLVQLQENVDYHISVFEAPKSEGWIDWWQRMRGNPVCTTGQPGDGMMWFKFDVTVPSAKVQPGQYTLQLLKAGPADAYTSWTPDVVSPLIAIQEKQ